MVTEATKAIEYRVEAARFAGQRNALVEAYDMYGRAAALLGPRADDDPPELRHRRLEIELGRLRIAGRNLDMDDRVRRRGCRRRGYGRGAFQSKALAGEDLGLLEVFARVTFSPPQPDAAAG